MKPAHQQVKDHAHPLAGLQLPMGDQSCRKQEARKLRQDPFQARGRVAQKVRVHGDPQIRAQALPHHRAILARHHDNLGAQGDTEIARRRKQRVWGRVVETGMLGGLCRRLGASGFVEIRCGDKKPRLKGTHKPRDQLWLVRSHMPDRDIRLAPEKAP